MPVVWLSEGCVSLPQPASCRAGLWPARHFHFATKKVHCIFRPGRMTQWTLMPWIARVHRQTHCRRLIQIQGRVDRHTVNEYWFVYIRQGVFWQASIEGKFESVATKISSSNLTRWNILINAERPILMTLEIIYKYISNSYENIINLCVKNLEWLNLLQQEPYRL